MGEINRGKVRAGGPDKLGKGRPPSPPPPLTVPEPGGGGGDTCREGVDGGVAAAGVGPCATSIYNDPYPFFKIGVCFNSWEGKVGSSALIGI